jgi:[CysO sulfur-carrier protein]-S-L-cysteine hydrolase
MRMRACLLRAIIRQAEEGSPLETCGYLAGVDDTVERIYPLENADQSAEHFSFYPAEQFAAMKRARAEGLRLIGVYHSHPATPARMSAEDIRMANDPEARYAIYSIPQNRLACFRVSREKDVTEETVQIVPD